MKKNAIAIACTVVLALILLLPVGLMGKIQPGSTVRDQDAFDAGDAPSSQQAVDSDVQEAVEEESAEQLAEELEGVEYVPDVVLVGLADGVSLDQVNERLQYLDYISTNVVSESDLLYGYVELALADDVNVADAIVRLEQESFVASSQPNYIYHVLDEGGAESASGTVQEIDGPLVAQHIDMVAQTTSITDPDRTKQWGLGAIKVYDAWDSAKGNHTVTVAVLDSGLDMDHPDFADAARTSNVVSPYSVLQQKAHGNTSNVDDLMGHGTHVAGIIAAGTNNGMGIAGVSYNAYIMPVQVIQYNTADGSNSVTSADAAAGVNYIVAHKNDRPSAPVRVINISFGTTENRTPSDYADRQFIAALESAHAADIMIVYAAGNGGDKGAYNCFPCDADSDGVGVISIEQQQSGSYTRAKKSNFNKSGQTTKELSAPGGRNYKIASNLAGSLVYSTWNDGGYKDDNGTSMAAPFVSGTAALMFAANKNLTAKQAKDILCATAQDLNKSANLSADTTFDYETGFGLVNAKDAVKRAKAGQVTPVAVKPITGATVTFSTSSYTYDGSKKEPSVSRVTLSDGTVLGSGDFKVLSYANNTNAGTATVTVGGIGNYTATATGTFKINPAPISSASLSQASFTYDGKAKNPTVYVYGPKSGRSGQLLSAATDYTLSTPSGRTSVGTYTYTVTGKGNYTGTKRVSFSVSKAAISWKRIWGSKALDTMKAIVDAGSWARGGAVVLVTDAGYHDGLTANGVAGLAGAPIVMTDGKSLSSQARSVISSLRPSSIIVCGGSLAVTDSVVSAARSAAGTSPKVARLWGQHADDTAVAIYRQGAAAAGGSWSTTAFVCTDKGYWDALSAAPISYAKHMPIFLTTGEGAKLSSSTLSAMRAGGVRSVYIVGGEYAVAPGVVTQLRSAGFTVSGRLWGQKAVDTSVKVAQFGLSQGMSANGMGIATTGGYWDALAGAALCGSKGAVIALADGPSAPAISGVAKANASAIAYGYVFGGTSVVSAATYNALPK